MRVQGRCRLNERPAETRVHDFLEVEQTLDASEAVEEATRCIQCKKPLCVGGCPVSIDIPSFIQAIATGDFSTATRIMKDENLFPAICGRVCPQEVQCEGACILGKKETPVRIGALERFIAAWETSQDPVFPSIAPDTGKSVAVVGSGPAGLAAAAELVKYGHRVTIFESLHEPGGVLVYGIPGFRLPKDIVRREISQITSLGATLKCNHIAGRSVSVPELLTFDAVFIGTGAGLPSFMGLPGEDLSGVYSANEFLTRVNLMHAERFPETDTPVRRGERAVVIGGGNVAMDAARVCRRLGCRVTLLYRRRKEDLPARRAEIRRAEEEGVEFLTCANPVRILGGPTVTGIDCVRMAMCSADETGRPTAVPVPESLFSLECDIVIEAIGQSPNPLLLDELDGIRRGPRGNVIVDDDCRTSIDRVYAAGDVATGAATVILAMGGAKRAALSIHRMLTEDS